MTQHVVNWLRPTQMVCGVTVEGRTPVARIQDLTCDRCTLRILRTGQALGWSEDNIREWSLAEMAALFTAEKAVEVAREIRARPLFEDG